MNRPTARDAYRAELVPLDGEGRIGRIARGLWAAVASWPPGLLPLPAVAELVITERTTGRTVHRRRVDSGEASGALAYVHERMADETPEQFRKTVGDTYYSDADRT
ncbi:hypothetical protein ATJ97_0509 [Georgenia soli]|uniref:Uncharacterized protein n=1 Tax=Georgenia soli TaxID=638953 RepID=A0A2A9EHP1_9MICO|nr:hypothetical protein [Georgenia soli]PFG38041.1 hypothetical protein ATJ97_0509 [Georgenia soli]